MLFLAPLMAGALDMPKDLVVSRELLDRIETVHLPEAVGSSASIAVDIFRPHGTVRGDLLVLPGWNYSRKRWYHETALLEHCQRHGLRAVFPEMGVTLYESQYYPDTRRRWAALPGGEWIRTMLLPAMKERGIFTEERPAFLLGLSTGGRGVALVHLQNPGIFDAGAALSGDFDQTMAPGDRLMQAQYGPFSSYQKRWRTVDNPVYDVSQGRWTMPVYIGHGDADRIVGVRHSRRFCRVLQEQGANVLCNFPVAQGHTFHYWNSELPAVFSFFNRYIR